MKDGYRYKDGRLEITDYSDNGISSIHLDGGEVIETILENLDFMKANRRFELRAELTYSNNGNTRTVEQYCSFDWMNTDWQYCALPVTLSEDPNDTLVGLKFVFDYSYNTNSADFFGISDTSLCVDEILQKVRVQVDEQGTKAAAATALLMRYAALIRPEEPVEMNVDRPFVFVISDAETGSVCFAGAVENPCA